jgi:hypothetical protein
VPPIGAPAAVDSPPIVVPAPPGSRPLVNIVPQVESYDEETYVCKQADTFRSICRDYYRAETYERALLLFNRNHPRAADGLRQDPPVLKAGQPVFIPPLRILEKQYPSAIPQQPAGAEPASRTSGTAAAVTLAAPRYCVRQGGEMVLAVAQRTLGKGDRWMDILRLNPGLNPMYPIPAGTVLQLPADARVEPADVP